MLGYSVATYLSRFQCSSPLWSQKLIPLLDYVLSNDYVNNAELSQAYFQIVDKYTNTNHLSLSSLRNYVYEMGYSYILDFFNPDEKGAQQLVQFLVLVHFLKGSRKGLELVLNLMGIGGTIVEWFETNPVGTVSTFVLEVDASTLTNNDNPQTFINFKTFVQNYVYPEVSFKLIYKGIVNSNGNSNLLNLFTGIITNTGENAISIGENSLIVSSYAISAINGTLDPTRTTGNLPYWYTNSFNNSAQVYQGIFTGNTTVNQSTITDISSASNLAVGIPISGTGIPSGTTIVSIDSPTQITISQNAIESLSNNSFTYNTITLPIEIPPSTSEIPVPNNSIISEVYVNAYAREGSILGDTTINSNVISNISDTSNLIQSTPIVGANIPVGTTIDSIDSPTQITISNNATSTAVGGSLNYYGKEFLLAVLHPPNNLPITYSDIVDYLINVQIQI